MIQEKDFLYRVPVKTAPITTPGGQIRNPEILVDVEGGEFMHGNILDANSTNKLINQSVKDAVDNKLIESGYVTKDLLEAETTRATEQENSLKTLIDAETSARTKGDEDLSSKIKAEQTRAEGKEKEISDKLAIVNGDSNTEGSFRKAIADVVAAAPEDLDTLKEIADKLAGNDDLHTALNQAITEKADASALLNEVTRATGAESGLQAAIATKADATALGNYVLTTALNKQVDTLNAAISAKQDAGNYIPYNSAYTSNNVQHYQLADKKGIDLSSYDVFTVLSGNIISIKDDSQSLRLYKNEIYISGDSDFGVKATDSPYLHLSKSGCHIHAQIAEGNPVIKLINSAGTLNLGINGIILPGGDNNHVLTSNASTIDITQYALKSQLDTKADSGIIDIVDHIQEQANHNTSAIKNKQDKGYYVAYSSEDDNNYYFHRGLVSSEPFVVDGSDGNMIEYGMNGIVASMHPNCLATSDGTFKPISDFVLKTELPTVPTKTSQLTNDSNFITANYVDEDGYHLTNILNFGLKNNGVLTIDGSGIRSDVGDGFMLDDTGITFMGRSRQQIPTAGGDFINISDLASAGDISSLSAGLSKKQNKITVNEVDVTDIETADITKLRTIVTNLINALSESDLIRKTETLE